MYWWWSLTLCLVSGSRRWLLCSWFDCALGLKIGVFVLRRGDRRRVDGYNMLLSEVSDVGETMISVFEQCNAV